MMKLAPTIASALLDLREHGPAVRVHRSSSSWRIDRTIRKDATMRALIRLGLAEEQLGFSWRDERIELTHLGRTVRLR
jgi:hypothetical protein